MAKCNQLTSVTSVPFRRLRVDVAESLIGPIVIPLQAVNQLLLLFIIYLLLIISLHFVACYFQL